MIIRKATEKDIPRIKELWDSLIEYHRKHFGYGSGIFQYKKDKDAIYLRFLKKQVRRRNAAIFVAEKEGKIVGHVMVEVGAIPPIYVHRKQAYICEIVVDEKHRGKGIGTALLEDAGLWAKKKGLYSISLMVHTGNKHAFSTYKSCGFEENHLKMVKTVK
ncbi:MAG: GNAT family N-acetyltransferase [Candidatus Micrarchaeota archaeon]